MSTKNFSSFENLVNLFTNLSNKLKTKVEDATLKDTVGFSVKNILNCDIASGSHTKNGLTIYVTKYIDDTISSIKVSGTATANTYIEIASLVSNNEYGELVGDNYILSGCPEGGSSSTYSLLVEGNFGSSFSDYGDGVLISNTIVNGKAYIVVKNGYTANNLYFYPMIRNKYVKDSTYERYYENVISRLNKKANLTDLPDLSNLVPQIQLKDTVGWTGKNILPPYVDASGKVSNGITFTVDNNGVITANGTATAEANFRLYNGETNDKHPFIGKNVILSGCPSGGSLNTYYISGYRVATQDGSGGTVTDIGNGVTFDYLNNGTGTKGRLDVIVKSGVTVNNIKFYPMLRYSDIADSTFEPCHESVDIVKANRNELIESVGYTGKNLAYNFIRTLVYNKAKLIKENNGFRVSMFEAKTWGCAQIFYDKLPKNTDFIFSCDVVITSGKPIIEIWGRPEIKNTGGTKLIDSYPLDGSHISLKFNSYTYEYISIALLASDNTSVNGNVLYDNFMIRDAYNIDDTYEDKKEIVEQSIKTDRTILKNTIGWVTKNLVHIRNTVGSETRNNISFIVNKDSNGELLNIVINGTAGNSSELKYITCDSSDGFYHLENGKEYILSGAPQGSSNEEGCFLLLQDTVNWTMVQDLGQGARFIADGTKPYRLSVCVAAGKTVDNAVFYPMLRPADIVDESYEPYHPSVEQTLRDNMVLASRNLLPVNESSSSGSSGVVWTLNNDGTISASGTATGTDAQFNISLPKNLNGKYKFTGCPSGGGSGSYDVYLWDNTTSSRVKKWDGTSNSESDFNGTFHECLIDNTHDIQLKLRVFGGKTAPTTSFKPMICEMGEESPAFEPYHGDLRQTLRDAEVLEGKNKLHIPDNVDTITTNGITYTINRNAKHEVTSIIANGTATSLSSIDLAVANFTNLVLSGCPATGSNSTYKVSYIDVDHANNQYNDYGSGVTIPSSLPSVGRWTFRIVVYSGYTANNLVFKPMLCTEEEWNKSHDFEPFYTPLKDIKFDREEQRLLGVGNLLDVKTTTTQTINGITFTVNPDKTVVANGTATANTNLRLIPFDNINYDNLSGRTLKLVGCPEGGTDSTYALEIWYDNGVGHWLRDTGDGRVITFPVNKPSNINPNIMIKSGTTVSNLIFKPMITTDLNATYNDFVPYAMTNRELTELATVQESACTDIISGASVGDDIGNHLYKVGKVVTLTLRLNNINTSAWGILCNIPSGYRPKSALRILNVTENALCPLQIDTNGNVKNAIAITNSFVIIHTSWITS